ncbi:hypothetical protein Q3G72_010220 [Acer saccharum]|nr:hypothetical protein Q3G72_010220 [Acer saccharum]
MSKRKIFEDKTNDTQIEGSGNSVIATGTHQVEPEKSNKKSIGQTKCMRRGDFGSAGNNSTFEKSTPMSIEDCNNEANKLEANDNIMVGGDGSGRLGLHNKNQKARIRKVRVNNFGENGKEANLEIGKKRGAVTIDKDETDQRNSKAGKWMVVADKGKSNGNNKKQDHVDTCISIGKFCYSKNLEVTQKSESVLGN